MLQNLLKELKINPTNIANVLYIINRFPNAKINKRRWFLGKPLKKHSSFPKPTTKKHTFNMNSQEDTQVDYISNVQRYKIHQLKRKFIWISLNFASKYNKTWALIIKVSSFTLKKKPSIITHKNDADLHKTEQELSKSKFKGFDLWIEMIHQSNPQLQFTIEPIYFQIENSRCRGWVYL